MAPLRSHSYQGKPRMGYPSLRTSNLPYSTRPLRVLVLLHEEHLRRFVQTWRLALATSVSLPSTDDPAYSSLGALGRHVLNAAGEDLAWMCEVFTLADPGIRAAPDAAVMFGAAYDSIDLVLD